MTSSGRRYLVKLLVSCSIFIFILTRIDWHAFTGTVKGADVGLLLLAFVLLWFERFWAVFKWRVLLTAQGASISMWRLFCIYCIGAFWGLFLPSSLSTDVIRGYYLSKSTNDAELSTASVVVDRMMGLFSLLFLCLVSVAFYSSTFDASITLYILIITVVSLLAAIIVHQESVPDILEQRILFFSSNRIGKKLIAMHRSFLTFKRYPMLMLASFANSLVLQVIRVVTIYVTGLAFGIEAELIKFFLVVPVTVIIIMVPVSIGGLGVREGSFVGLFSLVGVQVSDAFAISGTNSIMVTVIALLGGLVYLFYRSTIQREIASVKEKG